MAIPTHRLSRQGSQDSLPSRVPSPDLKSYTPNRAGINMEAAGDASGGISNTEDKMNFLNDGVESDLDSSIDDDR